jgi:hypothetical protein
MTYTEDQFNRLPKWAQSEIKSAENKARSAELTREHYLRFTKDVKFDVQLTALDGEHKSDWRGDIVAHRDPYGDNVPVARGRDTIRFSDPNNPHGWIDVSLRDGTVEIMADSSVFIRARAANVFYLYTER